jgi:hypothetical protein
MDIIENTNKITAAKIIMLIEAPNLGNCSKNNT